MAHETALQAWFSRMKRAWFPSIGGWRLELEAGAEGYCWEDDKVIRVGVNKTLREAKRLVVHELCHVTTCLEEANRHGKEWADLFAYICQCEGIEPLNDGCYRFFAANRNAHG